ncbi:MAG: hypothetical protein ACE5EF_06710 [Dehalococcoidia bacterium]
MRKWLTIPPDLVQQFRRRVDADPRGVRSAALAGAAVGLCSAVVLRAWMRLITEQEPVFTVAGTGLIFLVVSGFGAAAGYAFAVRHRPRGRIRARAERLLGFVPMLGMGPFMVFFAGSAILAWLPSHREARRWLRWALAGIGIIVTGFWILIFMAGGEDRDPSLARPLLYLAVSYPLFVSLRFAFTTTQREDPDYDPAVAGFAL